MWKGLLFLGLCSALDGFLHTSLFELKLFNSFPDHDIFPKLRHFYWYDSGRMGVWPCDRSVEDAYSSMASDPISDYCNSPNLLCAYLIFFFRNFFWTLFIYTTFYHQGCQSCKCKKKSFLLSWFILGRPTFCWQSFHKTFKFWKKSQQSRPLSRWCTF